jgi:cobalamin biosynthesis Co2+ chelatase CbiK
MFKILVKRLVYAILRNIHIQLMYLVVGGEYGSISELVNTFADHVNQDNLSPPGSNRTPPEYESDK